MSYGDESYRRTPSRGSSFFRPTPVPKEEDTLVPPSRPSSPSTKRAAQVKPKINVKIVKPKGKINLIFGFDITSSMGRFRDNIKEKVEYFCSEIKNLFPELVGDMEIAFVGIGDHCDGADMLQPTAFSSDTDVLKNNINSITDTNGGDTPEAYECLFREMNSWPIDGTNTVCVLVADSVPHGAGLSGDEGCPKGVDWQKELTALKKKLRSFYLVSCTDSSVVRRLQKPMADDEEHFIELGGNFTRLTNIIHGIIAKEVGEIDEYLAHLAKTRGKARATEVETLLKTQN